MDTPHQPATTPVLAAIIRRVQARVAAEQRQAQSAHPAHTASLAART
jgi:hypothetical protein